LSIEIHPRFQPTPQPPARLLFLSQFLYPRFPGSRCIFCFSINYFLKAENKKYTPCLPRTEQKHAPKKEAANLRLHNASS
jgi:hypothetical protein